MGYGTINGLRKRKDLTCDYIDQNPDVHKASDGALDAILEKYPQLKKQQADNTVSTKGKWRQTQYLYQSSYARCHSLIDAS